MSPLNAVVEMECLGTVVPVQSYQLCVYCFLYRESDHRADKKELVVVYEVSDTSTILMLIKYAMTGLMAYMLVIQWNLS